MKEMREKNIRLALYITEKQKERLGKYAKVENKTMSNVLRDYIDNSLMKIDLDELKKEKLKEKKEIAREIEETKRHLNDLKNR